MDRAFEPLDGALEPLDRAFEPLDGALEPLDGALEPFERPFEAVDRALEPFERPFEAVDRALEPFERPFEAVELRAQLSDLGAQLSAESLDLRFEPGRDVLTSHVAYALSRIIRIPGSDAQVGEYLHQGLAVRIGLWCCCVWHSISLL